MILLYNIERMCDSELIAKNNALIMHDNIKTKYSYTLVSLSKLVKRKYYDELVCTVSKMIDVADRSFNSKSALIINTCSAELRCNISKYVTNLYVQLHLLKYKDINTSCYLASNPALHKEVQLNLANNSSWLVRHYLCFNKNLHPDVKKILAKDPVEKVRNSIK